MAKAKKEKAEKCPSCGAEKLVGGVCKACGIVSREPMKGKKANNAGAPTGPKSEKPEKPAES